MRKHVLLISLPIFASFSIIGCKSSENYNVTFESKTLTIASVSLRKGSDFKTVVKMKDGLIAKYDMPVTLGNIQVRGGQDIKYTEYTYEINPDLESAKLVIPAKFITNNLKIVTEAKLVQHNLIFSKSEAFVIDKPTVGKNEALDTDIYVKDEWKDYVNLPSTLAISINDQPLDKRQFDYDIIKEGEKVHLKIDASLITGDIIVTSQVSPREYDVSLKGFEEITHLHINRHVSFVATNFTATISTTSEEYILPESLSITCVDSQTQQSYEIPPTKGYSYSPNTGALTIYGAYVFGDIKIDATAILNWRLTVDSSSDDTELLFYKDAGYESQIYKKQSVAITLSDLDEYYSIYVKTKDPVNKPGYIVPTTFDITINGEKVLGYTVIYGGIPSPIKDDKHYAKIQIQKDCVKGRLNVYGVAQERSKNVIKTTTIYLNTTGLPQYIVEPQALTCTFTPKAPYKLPLAENVNININGVWYDGNGYDESSKKLDGITYNETNGTLNITKEVVKTANEGSDIVIIAKPADVSVLKELTTGENTNWETLHALSKYGYNLFTPGETTGDFRLDGIAYPFQARLIGFKQERGATDTGYVQGLTLEFTTSIGQQQYYQTKTNNNTYYQKTTTIFESNLYKYLNDPSDGIVNKLPKELKANLYQVTKYGLNSDGANKNNSLNYLYPLSLSEMNEQIITPNLDNKYLNESANDKNAVYDYYKSFTTKDALRSARVKGYATSEMSSYWLRTPDLTNTEKDYYISGIEFSKGLANTEKQSTKGVAPAFCI